MNSVIVHYSEIGTKGKNRIFFEKKLIQNVITALYGLEFKSVRRRYGRIIITLSNESNAGEIKNRLEKVPGIASFSFGKKADLDMKDIKKVLISLAEKYRPSKFAVNTKRSNKQFKQTSKEVNEILGDALRKKGWRVDLEKPKRIFYVEIGEKEAYVYTEKIRGRGGLPVGSSGKVVSLMSGGIDSPVASYKISNRGCRVIFVHFFNFTRQRNIVKDKVERIVKVLQKHQPKTSLYLVPFRNLQNYIVAHVPSKYRMIIYRRIMFEIANKIAGKENALGFVTGDSVGQVASQTLRNLNVIFSRADYPIFSPLIGYDKQDIINLAKEIGTYEISVLPYSDCCSLLVAKHPETRAKLDEIEKIEKKLEIKKLIDKALREAEVKRI